MHEFPFSGESFCGQQWKCHSSVISHVHKKQPIASGVKYLQWCEVCTGGLYEQRTQTPQTIRCVRRKTRKKNKRFRMTGLAVLGFTCLVWGLSAVQVKIKISLKKICTAYIVIISLCYSCETPHFISFAFLKLKESTVDFLQLEFAGATNICMRECCSAAMSLLLPHCCQEHSLHTQLLHLWLCTTPSGRRLRWAVNNEVGRRWCGTVLICLWIKH